MTKFWRVWLKNWAFNFHFNFEIEIGVAGSIFELRYTLQILWKIIAFRNLPRIVNVYFANFTDMKFEKFCLSPPSRCRGDRVQGFFRHKFETISNILQKLTFNFVPIIYKFTFDYDSYKFLCQERNFYVGGSVIGARSLSSQSGVSFGDSGSPWLKLDLINQQYTMIGVLSYIFDTVQMVEYPHTQLSVCTNVSSYLQWIHNFESHKWVKIEDNLWGQKEKVICMNLYNIRRNIEFVVKKFKAVYLYELDKIFIFVVVLCRFSKPRRWHSIRKHRPLTLFLIFLTWTLLTLRYFI